MRLSLITLAAALALLANTALAGGLGEMTDAERTVFRDEVKQFLLENPEVITEAMQILQDRQDQAAAAQEQMLLEQNAEAIFKDPTSWVGGNPDGDLTIVEFMDYLSRPGSLRGDLTNRYGWDLCQSFMVCIGVRLPRADCGNCVL